MYQGQLTRANPNTGNWWQLGNGTEWAGSTCMAAHGNYLYIIQGANLVRTDLNGHWVVLPDQNGTTEAWAGSTCMAAYGNYLYIIQGANLVRADLNGHWVVLPDQNGVTEAWAGSTCMAAHGNYLYIIQGANLVRADLNGHWVVLPDQNGITEAWAGSTCIAAYGNYLYIVQGANLVLADLNGHWVVLPDQNGTTEAWAGSTCMAAYGKLFAATRDNKLWWRDPVGQDVNWQQIGHADNVVGMAAINGKLFAATRDNKLWWRDPVGQDVNWQQIGHAENVVGMAAINGKLFAATRDNKLWWRDPVGQDVNWQQIGHADNVVGMAAINGKLFAATRDNKLWWRDPVGQDVNWQQIGHADNVVGMAAINGKLFAATRDNKLWWRDPVGQDVNWQQIGHADNLVAMAGIDSNYLYIIQGNALVRANPANGHWQQLDDGDEWVGSTHIAAHGDSLYIIVQEAIRREFWRQKLLRVQGLFGGYTSEEAEDRALSIITSAESAGELIFLINSLTWDALDDDLDEPDLDQIARLLSQLLDRRDYSVNTILRGFFQNPEMLSGRPIKEVADEFRNAFTALASASRHSFVDQLLAKRDNLLDDIALMALRGLKTNVLEFQELVEVIQSIGQYQSNKLSQLKWEMGYTDLICSQLQLGEYRLLLRTLSDMVDPGYADEQRVALFDMLRRWDDEFKAMETLVQAIGTFNHKEDMKQFMDGREVFKRNFPRQIPPPDALRELIRIISAFFGQIADDIHGLRASVNNVAQTLADFSVADLLGTATDDIAVFVTDGLFGHPDNLLAVLPTSYKYELINRMLGGGGLLEAAEDEEEQAILKILRTSKERSTAEFLQLAAQTTWERLYNAFNGQEYDDLEGLFIF